MAQHTIATRKEWTAARRAHLAREKEFTRLRDELSRERRALPWERVEESYVFESPCGKESLEDLFAGRGQLAVYHFMMGPEWAEGCPGCSFLADHFDGMTAHLAARDVTLVVVSRAPTATIGAFQKRMGWRFKWVSSLGSDFNFDYGVSFTKEELAEGKVEYNYVAREFGSEEAPGLSMFAKGADGKIYHTYSTYARGLEMLVGTYMVLDMAPKGRDEEALERPMSWVRHHDKYEQRAAANGAACKCAEARS